MVMSKSTAVPGWRKGTKKQRLVGEKSERLTINPKLLPGY